MKQKLLNFTRLRSLVLLAVIAFLGAGQAWGEEVTVDFTSLGTQTWSNYSLTSNTVTISTDIGNGSAPTTNNAQYRWKTDNIITISTSTGTLKSIQFKTTSTEAYGPKCLSYGGSAITSSGTSYTWEAPSNITSAAFTVTSEARLTEIHVTYTTGGSSAGGGDGTATLTASNLELTGSYTTNTSKTIDGITYVYTDLMLSSNRIQAKASSGTIKNTTAYPGDITSVVITHNDTGRATTINGSADGTNWTQVATGSGSITADFSGKGYKYFQITRGSNAAYWTKIEITYSTSSSSLDPSDLAIANASTDLSFDLYNNATAQVISYNTSSTGAITIAPASPTSYFSYVHDAANKTITVTPLAVTPSAQTITISQEADEDYYAGTASFTVSVANSTPLANIAALTEKSAGNYVVSLTNALVTYVHGNNAYLEDASGAVLLYGCKGNLAAGDKITGTANVTYTVYNNLPEVTAFTLAEGYTKTTGNTVTPTELTIATLESNYSSYISRYVKIVGATVKSAFASKNSTIEQSGSSIVLRDQNSSATLTTTVNDIVTVTAHPAIFNSTHQIAVYEQSQIEVAKVNPTITFNNGSVRVGNDIDLSTLFTSNSNGAVTYSITTGGSYATLVGSTLTATAEGSVTVKAEQAESSSYNAGEATATITVNPALVLSSIAVTTAPTKTTYNEGETFDPTGMVITATYTTNDTEPVTGYTYTPDGTLTTSDTEITISYTSNGVTKTTTQAITVNEVIDYATLPFSFDGGKGDIQSTVGLTQSGLGSDYSDSNAPLKFDGQGDYVILKINERPGTLSFNIKNNSFSGGTFTVQTSEDGTTYTDHKSYTEITGTQAEEIDDLGENVRYIKWIYTNKASGNVGLGNIRLTAYGATPTYTLSWTAGEGTELFVFDAADTSNPLTSGDPLAEGTTIQVSVDVSSGYTFESLVVKDANNDDVTVTEPVNEGEPYEFTMPASNVTITSTATASSTPTPVTGSNMFVKVTSTSDITDGKYLIVYEDGNVAFDGGRDNDTEMLDAASNTIAVTIDNGTIASNATTNAAVFTIDATNGTIQSASGFYIGAENYNNELKTSGTTPYNNSLEIDNSGNAEISMTFTGGTVSMRYNSASNQTRFRYYKSGQQAIQLYKFVYAPTSLTLNSAGYATFASTSAVDFTDDSEFSAWQITEIANNNTITFSQITGTVAAGTGVLLKGAGSASIDLVYATSGDELTDNLLVGTTFPTPVENDQFYGLSGNTFVKVNGGGTVKAGKALLPAKLITEGNSAKAFTFVFEGADGIKTVEHVSAEEAAEIFNLAGQRLQKAQRGVNIINGKKVLVK